LPAGRSGGAFGLAKSRLERQSFSKLCQKKMCKNIKELLLTQMAALVVVNPNRFRLPNAATKKAVRLVDYNYTIQIFRKKNNNKLAFFIFIKTCTIKAWSLIGHDIS